MMFLSCLSIYNVVGLVFHASTYMSKYWKGANACEAHAAVRSMRTDGRHRDPNDSRMRKEEASMAAAAYHM